MRALVLVALSGAAGVVIWFLVLTNSRPPEELFRAAIDARERGDTTQLRPAIHALEDDPAYADHVQVLSAALELAANRPDAALGRLAPLPQEGPLRGTILQLAGEALHRLGHLPEAEVVLRTLAAEEPDNAAAHRLLGVVYYDLGAYEPAIVEFNRLLELTPDDFRPHRLLGLMYWDFELYSEAIPHYEQVLALDPEPEVEREVRIELARSLIGLHRYDEALPVLETVSDSALAQVVAAQCHWNLNRPEEARALIASARSIDPEIREAFLLEADIRSSDGDHAGALEVMREAVAAHPHDAECRYRLALLLEQTGDPEEAAAEMAIWEEKKELATRLTELNFQALHDPHNAELRDEIADICEALGKDELARIWRQAAEACREGAEFLPAEPLPSG